MKRLTQHPVSGAILVVSIFAALSITGVLVPEVALRACISLLIITYAIFYNGDFKVRASAAFISFLVLHTTFTNPPELLKFLEYLNFPLVGFLLLMMYIMAVLDKLGLFQKISELLLKICGKRAWLILVVFFFLAWLLSGLVDEVTAGAAMYRFLARLIKQLNGNTAETSQKIRLSKMVIFLVVILNIGSSWTMVGNPIGLIVGNAAHLVFVDFLLRATPVSFACLIEAMVMIVLFVGKSEVAKMQNLLCKSEFSLQESYNKTALVWASAIFVGVVCFIALHNWVEEIIPLIHGYVLVLGTFVLALATAIVGLHFDKSAQKEIISKELNRGLVVFLAMFFLSVGALSATGLIAQIAGSYLSVAGNNNLLNNLFVTLAPGTFTSFFDNVLAVSSFVPMLEGLQSHGIPVNGLFFQLLFSGTLFGSFTFIGSTVNILLCGLFSQERPEDRDIDGKLLQSYAYWFRYAGLTTVVNACTAFLFVFVMFN